MLQSNQRSIEELKRDSERTRADLIDTVDHLRSKASETASDIRERLSPDAIKGEVGGYLRSRGERLIDKVRDNPLQAVAIGAGIAYPLLGVVRSIPIPVLMIGAGLFLAGKTGKSFTREVADKASDAADRFSDGADAMRRSALTAGDFAVGQASAAGDALSLGVDALKQKAGEAVDALKDRAAALAAQSSQAAEAASGAARQGADDAVSSVQGAFESAAQYGAEAGSAARDRAGEAVERAATIATDTMQRHPLLVGGIGLAVGAFIAACLPRSELEEGLMGEASSAVQNRANELAARGLETAKDVAAAAYAGGAERAEQEGLTPDDLHAAAQGLGEKIRKVADSATTAAFGTDD
jgi:ElaB/YqjD/DUF883 family membrane-anchored ribosome-binding protein